MKPDLMPYVFFMTRAYQARLPTLHQKEILADVS